MLIVALVRGDERIVGHVAGLQVFEQSALPFESYDVLQVAIGIAALLHVQKICKGVVLDGVESDESLRLLRQQAGDRNQIGEEAIGVIYTVGSRGRQAFLVALPAHSLFIQLVRYGLAGNIRRGGDRINAINVGYFVDGRRGRFVREVERRGRGIRSSAPDRANRIRVIVVIRDARRQIGDAIAFVTIRRVVVENAEVRSPYHFEVIGQAGM